MAAVTTLCVVNIIALAYCAKYDNGKKEKSKTSNFLSYYLVIDCVTTLTGIPA